MANVVNEILRIAGISFPKDPMTTSLTEVVPYTKDRARRNLVALGAIGRNPAYVRELRREVGSYLAKLKRGELKAVQRFYNRATGRYQDTRPISITKVLDGVEAFEAAAEDLAYLVQNRVLSLNTELKVRPIDLETGTFTKPQEEKIKEEIAEAIGFPSSGVIRLSERLNNVNSFGYTFTAVDIKAFAIFGDLIVEMKGLVGISWSKHRDQNPDRRLFESSPKYFTKGAKTYAGTMVFALFNENPMRANSPIEFFHGHLPIAPSSALTEFMELDSTDLPGFDLVITFTNEYGAAASMSIWGITITDEGGSITTRALENEEVYTYRAVKIDPIIPVSKGENGEINFIAPNDTGISRFERKRRMNMLQDMAGGDLESAYQSTLDKLYSKLTGLPS